MTFTYIFFDSCFTHQTNLIIGEIFKESSNLIKASKKAIYLIIYFNRSVYFISKLHDEQIAKYKKHYAFLLSCATC